MYHLKYDIIRPKPFCFSGLELMDLYINSIGHYFEGDSNDQ